MIKMPIDKLTPIIDENFPHSHPFQIVDRRTVEGSDVMDLVANTALRNRSGIMIFCSLREN
jgi:hypothetical protein